MLKIVSSRAIQLGLILLLAILILGYKINKPFVGHHDWNSVVYSNIARNYLRYGYLQTKLGQVRNPDIVNPNQFNYLTHYPPLLPLMISVSFRLFGINEAAARLIPILASLLMLVCLYIMGEITDSKLTAVLACIFTITTPLFIYFGKLPVHETVVPAFSLVAVVGYLKLLKVQKLRYYLLIVLGVVLGGLVNWTGYYISIAIVFHALVFRQKLSRRFKLSLFLLTVVCVGFFGLHLIHLRILTGSYALADLFKIMLFRVNFDSTPGLNDFTLGQYIIKEIQYVKIYFTNILLGLIVLWIIWFVKNFLFHKYSRTDGVLFLLLVYGMIHPVIFKNLFYIHDYMIYYLLPFVALASATVIKRILLRLPSYLKYSLPILLVFMMFQERIAFTKVLLDSHSNDKGVEIAKFINTHTRNGELSFVTSNNYKQFYEVFITYYSDRQVSYGEQLPYSQINLYQLVIRPKAHDALSIEDKSYLDKQCSRKENDQYIWYFIH